MPGCKASRTIVREEKFDRPVLGLAGAGLADFVSFSRHHSGAVRPLS